MSGLAPVLSLLFCWLEIVCSDKLTFRVLNSLTLLDFLDWTRTVAPVEFFLAFIV